MNSEEDMLWEQIEKLVDQIAMQQKDKLYQFGRKIIPTLTEEDILQPNDYNELEHHPFFRYEEGLLAGIQTVQTALFALKKDVKQ